MPERATGGLSAVERALEVLAVATHGGRAQALAEIAAQADLPKPTTHRILRILVKRGLLRQNEDRTYSLGPVTFALAAESMAQLDYSREARDAMEWLQGVTPETIHFTVLIGESPVYVAKVESHRPYQMASRIGAMLTMHSTASGKVILAYLPPERAAPYLAAGPYEARTAMTITSADELARELVAIRARGFSIDDEENEEHIRCVAAPVFDARGEVMGALSVSAPDFNLSMDHAMLLGASVVTACHMVSRALGAPASMFVQQAPDGGVGTLAPDSETTTAAAAVNAPGRRARG